MAVNVLIDTEIGDNIDDAFAVALACCSPELHLVGVTTTYYEAEVRALLARRLLAAYGRPDVPVAAGDHPRYAEIRGHTPPFSQRSFALQRAPLSIASPLPAVEFMARTLAEHTGTTLVGTAPLTNIGALLRRYPRIERHISQIVFMGGWSSQAMPEFNIKEDLEAASIVLRSQIPLIAVGYESTLGCVMRRAHLLQLQIASGEGPSLLRALAETWSRAGRRTMIMYDPLTVASLCRPHLVKVTSKQICLRMEEPGAGSVYEDAANGRRIGVSGDVDEDAYMSLLMNRVAPTTANSLFAESDPAAWRLRMRAAYALSHYPGWRVNHGCNDHHTFGYIKDGSCFITVQEYRQRADAGTVVYIPRNVEFSMEAPEGMEGHWLHFDVEMGDGAALSKLNRIPGVPLGPIRTGAATRLAAQVDKAVRYYNNARRESVLLVQAALQEIVAHLLSVNEEIPTRLSPAATALRKAKEYIESHVCEPLSLDDLSRVAYLSKFHLARLFKEAYGQSPAEYQTALRMQQAESLLRLNHLSTSEVAQTVGYSTVQAFGRAFKRTYGTSPAKYRNERQRG